MRTCKPRKVVSTELTVLTIALSIAFSASVKSQSVTPDLQRIADAIERSVNENHPDWKLQRVEPVLKTANVIIDQWRFDDSGVRVSFVPYNSANEAVDAIQRFSKGMNAAEEFRDVGDGGYWFGLDRAELAFTKGRIAVFISPSVEMSLDPSVDKTLSPKDRMAEERRISTELAEHAAKAADSQ